MQTPITGEVLGRAGITESLISRTLQTLQVLDLVDDDGQPTQVFEGIRIAPESEYKSCVEAWLKAAYADVFTYVDPSKDSETQVRDAFRTYKPHGQQSRMVSLFLGLCKEAGLIEEIKRETQRSPRTVSKSPRGPTKKSRKRKAKDDPQTAVGPLPQLPSPILGLLGSLPKENGSWSQERRDQFITTLGAVLDFCYSVGEPEAEDEQEPSEKTGGQS